MLRAFSLFAAFLLMLATAHAAGLEVKDLKVGTGAEAVDGTDVTVHYTGWLMNGKKFDSSVDRGKPFTFSLGSGSVIPGWEKGVLGMKVGGKRELIIPPELAYGDKAVGGVIPANSTLKFDVELLAVKEPKFSNIDDKQLAAKLEKGVPVIDVRRPDEWKKTGVLKGSKLLTFFDQRGRINPNFLTKFKEIAKPGDEVVLICRTGNRSRAIAKFLSERLGYLHVDNVKNGITHWIADKGPVTAPDMPKSCWLC